MDEVYAYSELTDTWYRVDDYEEAGPDGKIVANGKTEVDQEDVPEHWQKAIKNNAETLAGPDGSGNDANRKESQ
jgi:hypothetical protein